MERHPNNVLFECLWFELHIGIVIKAAMLVYTRLHLHHLHSSISKYPNTPILLQEIIAMV